MVKVEPEPEYDDDCVIVEVDVKPIFCKLEVLDKGPNSSSLSDGLLLEENVQRVLLVVEVDPDDVQPSLYLTRTKSTMMNASFMNAIILFF